MKKWLALPGIFRPPFLLLTPACVLLGLATASHEPGEVDFVLAMLVLIGALSAHMSVNAFNEVQDFQSGLDLKTRRTPFSGGSGTLPENPELLTAAIFAACFTLVFTVLIGIWMVILRGAVLLPIGALGVLLVLGYTRWITRNPWLCLIAPGTGFGILMVMGTHVVLTGEPSPGAWLASIPPFFLINNLLLLNQFPDQQADRAAGRSHLLIRHGAHAGRNAYLCMLALAYGSLLFGTWLGPLPTGALLGLLTIPMGAVVARGVWNHFADDMDALLPFMGMNVLISLATPTLMAIGILLLDGS